MSLIKIINSEHSAEFGQLITDIKANVLSYLEARQKAQKERMIIIGKIAEYKSIYHQRSKEDVQNLLRFFQTISILI